MLRLHDTASGEVRELALRDAGRASLYICGGTVYAPPHIGHGRFVLVFDLLRRYLEHSGLDVDHVSNVTDIDDKIIRRAEDESRPWQSVAEEYEGQWWSAMDRLGALRPTAVPHATDYIDEMIALVGELVGRGVAYETADGVYLSVEQVDGYGLLAHQPLDSLRAGARVAVDEEKRSPADFALWKKAKSGEPSWESPFGDGRPGWHTECVVMSLDLVGEGFDLHGGGQDLIFPHHENERAQAVALGKRFANHWAHNGMVEIGGEKMSKSLGNFTTIDEMLAGGTDARAYRLLVARSHYRSPIEVSAERVDEASTTLGGLDAFARRLREVAASSAAGGGTGDGEASAELRARFEGAMGDDLASPSALAALFEAVRKVNLDADRGDAAAAVELGRTVVELLGVLGIRLHDGAPPIDDDTVELVGRRDAARAARDFASADAIRDQLVGFGWTVEDTPGGTRIYR